MEGTLSDLALLHTHYETDIDLNVYTMEWTLTHLYYGMDIELNVLRI